MDFNQANQSSAAMAYGGGGSGTLAGYGGPLKTAQQEQATPIRDQITTLDEQLMNLHAAISEIEQRFDTVIMPIPPNVASAKTSDAPTPPQSDVLSRLMRSNRELISALQRLHSFRQRAEV